MSQSSAGYQLTKLKQVHLFGVCCLLGLTGTINTDTPESYLTHRWYNIEFIVFEKLNPAPTSELVIHAVEKRVLPSDTVGMQFSDEEQRQIAENSGAVNFDAILDDFFFDNPWHVSPTLTLTDAPNKKSESENRLEDGCWLHQVEVSAEAADVEDRSLDLTARIAALLGEFNMRDARLPDWLPDEWQTFDQNFIDAASALGLCEEDMRPLFDEQYLDFLGLPTSVGLNGSAVDEDHAVDAEFVRKAYSEYELELKQTARTPRHKALNLEQTAISLRNNGYRIIDHFAWHQPGLARGTERNVLVQFGHLAENGFREVEGTISFSVARFLHLSVNLWRFVDEPPNYDAKKTGFTTPLFFYELRESRRLALGELHYLDHPKFGVLVQIRRVPVPERLTKLVEELSSSP